MSSQSGLTTKAAEIRAGLVADWRKAMEGVSAGPWFMKDFDTELSVSTTDGSAPLIADLIEQGDAQEPGYWGSEYQIGQWIARCSPAGIAPLLALIEQQAAELAEARKEHRNIQTALMEETARTIAAERRATTAESERDELLREKERLGAVLDAAVELADLMDDTVGGSYTPDSFTTQPIRLALSALENGPAGLADAHSKSPDPSSQSERIAVLEAALGKVKHWAESRCPCHNEQPNPCPLCGASVENLEACKSAENTLPRDVLEAIRKASPRSALAPLGEE